VKGICPECGAVASLALFAREETARQTLAEAAKLPAAVLPHYLDYLSLYRPQGRAMSAKRALGITRELSALVNSGYVRYKGKPDRPCPPSIWGQAMERMHELKNMGRLTLPMTDKDHSYLRSIAHDIADKTDRAAETTRNAAERTGNAIHRPDHTDAPEPISREELRQIRESNYKPHRRPAADPPNPDPGLDAKKKSPTPGPNPNRRPDQMERPASPGPQSDLTPISDPLRKLKIPRPNRPD
jgi:hypothetical protein